VILLPCPKTLVRKEKTMQLDQRKMMAWELYRDMMNNTKKEDRQLADVCAQFAFDLTDVFLRQVDAKSQPK
jgi:hypothetical protein